MALSTRSNASSNLLGGTVKENEMLARAGIKPRTAANPSRTALGNISNRAAVPGKQNLKDKENVPVKPRLVKATGTTSLQSKVEKENVTEKVVKDDLKPVKEAAPASPPQAMDISQSEAFSKHLLPVNVQDIDQDDGDNPQLVAEYVNDIYDYMRQLEEKYSINQRYLEGGDLSGRMRAILVDWLVQVHLRFHLLQETLYLTIAIIDRFLQLQSVSRSKLQLVGVTSMLIASKYEEMYAPEIADFVYITDNAYSKADIRRMECLILKTLNFNLGRPLPLHFLRRNSKAGEVNANTHSLAKYLMELTIVDYDMCHIHPSTIAASALCLSIKLLDEGDWNETLSHYSKYGENELLPVMKKMAVLVTRAGTGKLTAIKTKYASSKFMKISNIPELKSPMVEELARSDQ